MNREELKQIVADLDKVISKENARVSMQRYGGDLDEAFIVATENGYLRLGVEFLKAGLTPYLNAEKVTCRHPNAIDVDLDYLVHEDSDVQFDYFERNEDIKIKTYNPSWVDRAIPVVMLAFLLSVLILAIAGAFAIVKGLA
jgi:hypothetical protein